MKLILINYRFIIAWIYEYLSFENLENFECNVILINNLIDK